MPVLRVAERREIKHPDGYQVKLHMDEFIDLTKEEDIELFNDILTHWDKQEKDDNGQVLMAWVQKIIASKCYSIHTQFGIRPPTPVIMNQAALE